MRLNCCSNQVCSPWTGFLQKWPMWAKAGTLRFTWLVYGPLTPRSWNVQACPHGSTLNLILIPPLIYPIQHLNSNPRLTVFIAIIFPINIIILFRGSLELLLQWELCIQKLVIFWSPPALAVMMNARSTMPTCITQSPPLPLYSSPFPPTPQSSPHYNSLPLSIIYIITPLPFASPPLPPSSPPLHFSGPHLLFYSHQISITGPLSLSLPQLRS